MFTTISKNNFIYTWAFKKGALPRRKPLTRGNFTSWKCEVNSFCAWTLTDPSFSWWISSYKITFGEMLVSTNVRLTSSQTVGVDASFLRIVDRVTRQPPVFWSAPVIVTWPASITTESFAISLEISAFIALPRDVIEATSSSSGGKSLAAGRTWGVAVCESNTGWAWGVVASTGVSFNRSPSRDGEHGMYLRAQ